jgi:hypothetical protein
VTRLDTRHLPATGGDNWRDHAACTNVADSTIFFPAKAASPDAITAAAHCHSCPSRTPCWNDAVGYPRLTGVVQGGFYWTDGQPVAIAAELSQGPSRSQEAMERRRTAIARFYEIRHLHKNDTQAYHQIADEYGISIATIYAWHRDARRAADAKLETLDRKSGEPA